MFLVEPILAFDRQCEEAIELYKRAFGAEVIELIRFVETDPSDLYKSAAEEDNNLIFHAKIRIGKQVLLVGDGLPENMPPNGRTVTLTVMNDSHDKIKAAYEIIAEGATILEPESSSTYSSFYVSLVDKFGIPWQLLQYTTER